MTFAEKLMYNYDKGYMSLVKDKDGDYSVFSTLDGDGYLRRTNWNYIKEVPMNNIGSMGGVDSSYLNKEAEQDNWEIIEAIPFSSLGGEFEEGDKVQAVNLNIYTVRRVIEARVESDSGAYLSNMQPVFPEDLRENTITIEGKEYSEATIKKALQEYVK